MHTKESVLNNSSMAKALAHIGQSLKGVLTTLDMASVLNKGQNFQVITNGEVFWFTDDCEMVQGEIARQFGFVGVSKPCPLFLPAKRKLPSKMITTAEKLIAVYYSKQRQITSVEELVDYLNANPKQ